MKKNKNKNKNIFMLLATQITFVVLLMSVLSASAIATDSGIGIYIDGLKVRVEPIVHSFPRSQLEPESPETIMGRIEYQSIYYMDVEPEIVSGRVFVPIRAISNYLDLGGIFGSS